MPKFITKETAIYGSVFRSTYRIVGRFIHKHMTHVWQSQGKTPGFIIFRGIFHVSWPLPIVPILFPTCRSQTGQLLYTPLFLSLSMYTHRHPQGSQSEKLWFLSLPHPLPWGPWAWRAGEGQPATQVLAAVSGLLPALCHCHCTRRGCCLQDARWSPSGLKMCCLCG